MRGDVVVQLEDACKAADFKRRSSLRDDDQRRPQHPVVDQIALLKHGDNVIGRGGRIGGFARDRGNRLVQVRVESLPRRVELDQLVAFEDRGQQAQRSFDAFADFSTEGASLRSASSRLSRTGNSDSAKVSMPYLVAFATSSWPRRRTFSVSATARR